VNDDSVTRTPRRGPALPPALRYGDFRGFWIGQAVSLIGTQFTNVAMAWQIYQMTNSALQLGLLGLARAIPQMALTLVGGMLADAVDRRRIMIATQLGQGTVAAALVLLTVTDAMTPTALYVASGLFALFAALDNPARQAYVPNLVPRADLTSAIALTTSMRQVSYILGPALGGVVLAVGGSVWCYGLDTAARLAAIGLLLTIRVRQAAGGRRRVSLASLLEGLAFVRSQPTILWLMVLDFVANFFGSPRALLPIYARDTFQVGPEGLGILYAASSIGSLSGGLAMSMIGQPRNAGRWVLLGVTFYACSVMAFALSPTFAVAVVLLALMGVGDTVSSVLRGTINQLLTPDELRGRVSAVNSIFVNVGPQLGQFRGGVVAAWWGTVESVFTGGLATLIVVGLVALVPAVRRFKFPQTSPESPSATRQPSGV
jgi:MFS family permease